MKVISFFIILFTLGFKTWSGPTSSGGILPDIQIYQCVIQKYPELKMIIFSSDDEFWGNFKESQSSEKVIPFQCQRHENNLICNQRSQNSEYFHVVVDLEKSCIIYR